MSHRKRTKLDFIDRLIDDLAIWQEGALPLPTPARGVHARDFTHADLMHALATGRYPGERESLTEAEIAEAKAILLRGGFDRWAGPEHSALTMAHCRARPWWRGIDRLTGYFLELRLGDGWRVVVEHRIAELERRGLTKSQAEQRAADEFGFRASRIILPPKLGALSRRWENWDWVLKTWPGLHAECYTLLAPFVDEGGRLDLLGRLLAGVPDSAEVEKWLDDEDRVMLAGSVWNVVPSFTPSGRSLPDILCGDPRFEQLLSTECRSAEEAAALYDAVTQAIPFMPPAPPNESQLGLMERPQRRPPVKVLLLWVNSELREHVALVLSARCTAHAI